MELLETLRDGTGDVGVYEEGGPLFLLWEAGTDCTDVVARGDK
jgi:hypothetical protein